MEAIHAFCPTGKITLTTVTGQGNPKLAPGGMYSSLLCGVSFMLRGRCNLRGGLTSKETLQHVWGDLSRALRSSHDRSFSSVWAKNCYSHDTGS